MENRKKKLPTGPSDLIFPARDGKLRHVSELVRPFHIALKEMGITRRLTIHGMRRTYNNLVRQAETDTIIVQSMTGHSDDRMTQHYSHVSLDEKRRALEKLFGHIGMAPGLRESARIGDLIGDHVQETKPSPSKTLPN
jgi:integrase